MLEKLKAFTGKIGKKGKAMLFAAIMAVSTCAMTVAASAAEVAPLAEAGDEVTMESMLKTAGDTLISSFNSCVQVMIPVIIGILGGSLVVFGIFALIKLAKKIFGHVTS